MTDAEPAGEGLFRNPAELARRLREAADRLMGGSTGATGPSPPALPGIPLPPATMSARHLHAVLDDLAARRGQVQALRAQLQGFDEQLGALEASLTPLLARTRTWADLEAAVTDPGQVSRQSLGQPPTRSPGR